MSIDFDPSHLVWTEKYRPQSIDACIVSERIKAEFKSFVNEGQFTHLMLSGGPGIGKTTIAKALCNDIGVDFLVLNASNERGIDVLRNTITQFATTVSFNEAKLKCVILDEFDNASPLLQAGMRQAIEDFSKTCRFIFTCNYPNKIIPAIHSRCAKIALALESNEKADVAVAFLKRMESMLKQEGVKFERKALVTLIQKYFPDFRRTINELQRLSRAGDLTMEVVEQVSDDVNITKRLANLLKCYLSHVSLTSPRRRSNHGRVVSG